MIIGKNKISKDSKVFIIAEVGINHNGSLDLAKKMYKQTPVIYVEKKYCYFKLLLKF